MMGLRGLLECEKDTPILKTINKTFTSSDKLLFLEEAYYKSDKFTLQVNISRKRGRIVMNLIVVDNYEELSKVAAKEFAKVINEKPNAVLGLATGGSPDWNV